MSSVTYYVALPFLRSDDGTPTPGEAMECQGHTQAQSRAAGMAKQVDKGYIGAVAFSRKGDPNMGDFDPAVIVAQYGEVPDDLSDL